MRAVFKTSLIVLGCAAGWAVPATGADVAQLSLTQLTAVNGRPLPRPTVGVAFAGGSSLTFHLALTYHCPAGQKPGQLFVSIADTGQLVETAGADSPQTIRMDVPVSQLSWLMERDLACDTVAGQRKADEIGTSGIRYYRLQAGTSGSATLLCAGQDGPQASAAASTPLDVWLSCPGD